MVQQGAKAKDISDIISIGADDANDYMAATGGVDNGSDESSSAGSQSITEEAASVK